MPNAEAKPSRDAVRSAIRSALLSARAQGIEGFTKEEIHAYIAEVLAEDRSIDELVDAAEALVAAHVEETEEA